MASIAAVDIYGSKPTAEPIEADEIGTQNAAQRELMQRRHARVVYAETPAHPETRQQRRLRERQNKKVVAE